VHLAEASQDRRGESPRAVLPLGSLRVDRARRRGVWPIDHSARRAIPCSELTQQRQDIIRNRVALAAEESVSVGTRRY
jgi:hypothetical protein